MSEQVTFREKLQGVRLALGYNPWLAAGIVGVNLATAIFEGIGVGLLLPIIESAQSGGDITANATGISGYFATAYDFVGLPLTLESLIIGLASTMTLRYGLSFVSTWLQVRLRTDYLAHLRHRSFQLLLGADISYLDERNGDDLTNTIVTEIAQSSGIISRLLSVVQTACFAIIYFTVALVIAPELTLVSAFLLGGVIVFTRYVIQPGYEIGDRVAAANERIQELVHAGVRGMRDIKLFNMREDLTDEYNTAHEQLVETRVKLARNQAGLNNFTQLLNAFALFALVYIAVSYLSLSFAALGVFLFAMFRLSPMISTLNNTLYSLDGALPHLLRSHDLIEELERHSEPSGGEPAPSPVRDIELEDVTFQYDGDDEATDIQHISMEIEYGETVALVGPSGAGKSTIVSLIARLYAPDEGEIRVNGRQLQGLDSKEWHERVTMVPQHPFIFNESLRYNITVGNPEATEREVDRVCEVSQVKSFLEELPNGLDSQLGDDAVRLSGGQRQRVAIARALLTDAEVLLLDEATSELDSRTENAIISGLEALDGEYLTVVVGHQLAAVKHADRIYAIQDGNVAEIGPHQELLANDGVYADLYGDNQAPPAGQ